mmetsp:Transcript_6810/g.12337  ORF Transcript_6810/g.12337 Transcript_6810/m.12337 type:complete len:208 (+) Transcript_6810:509-1132(+)
MLLDVLRAAGEHADALGGLALQEAEHQILRSHADVGRKLDAPVFVHDAAHDHHGVVGLGRAEGLPAREQNVHQHAQPPPVHRVVVAVREHVFGRHVAGGAAKGVRPLAVLQHLGEPEVAQLDVALLVDEHVLGLKVAVDGVVVVEVGEREDEGADVEARQLLLHPLEHLHLGRQAAALQVALGHAVVDHLGFRHQHVHQVARGEKVE